MILHRDISENNIVITKAAAKGDPKGMLFDLDLAKELDGQPSGARHRTGTMQFMAIEVLEGYGHTYRHDLESLFFTFLYGYAFDMAMKAWAGRTLRSTCDQGLILRGWYTGTYTEIANSKQGHMSKNRFENVLTEFAPNFENLKPLARELRSALFPIRDGDIFTGTFQDRDIMYDGMIKAFDRAIDDLRVEQAIHD